MDSSRPEVGGLHRSRATAGEHGTAGKGQAGSELGGGAVDFVATQYGVTAHDPDDRAWVQMRCHVIERVSYGVIMKSGGKVGGQCPSRLTVRPGIDGRIRTYGIAASPV